MAGGMFIDGVNHNHVPNVKVDEEKGVENKHTPNVVPMTSGAETPENTQVKKALKAGDLDYSKFPRANRLDASEFAERSLNEVKDLAREFNKDFPQNPYITDFDSFPRPESYTSKQYGGKDRAYVAWKSAVKEWVEDCKQDMDAGKDVGMQDLASRFEQTVQKGFFNLYIQNGMTQQEIFDVYQALEGDINKVKQELDSRIKKDGAYTRQVVKDAVADQANWVVGEVRRESNGIHQHIHEVDMASTNRDFEIMDKADNIQNDVDKIKKNQEEEAKKAELKTQIGNAMRNHPKEATEVIRKTLRTHGIQYDKDNAFSTHYPTQAAGTELMLDNLDIKLLEDIIDKLKYEGVI